MDYANTLPKRIKSGGRCQRLTENAERCRKKALYETYVFEDDEHWGGWYVITVCAEHLEERDETKELHK